MGSVNPLENLKIIQNINDEEKDGEETIEFNVNCTNDDFFGKIEGEFNTFNKHMNRNPQMHNVHSECLEVPSIEVRRSKRKILRQSFAEFNENGLTIGDNQDDDEYRLIKLSQFEKDKKEQPMMIYMSFQSYLLMNLHAHLFYNEIIGFNAGYTFTHKNGKQAIYVHEAYPVKPLDNTGTDRTKTVEMDPESSELVRHIVESKGQTICGWYHSHPIFDTNPSKIDISNQGMYQEMFNNDNNKPFIAFIVGPYSPKLNSNKVISEFRSFSLINQGGKRQPYELNVNIVPQK